MISIKNAVLMGTLSLLTIQNNIECVFSGFWNKLSNMTGYKFKKEQNNQSSQKSSPTQENNLAIVPKKEEQKTVKHFLSIPALIGNYRKKTSHDLNRIITEFKKENRDMIIMVLFAIAESDPSDKETISNLANIHKDLGSQKSLSLIQLVQKLAVKSNQNSAVVITFINEQRGKYTIKDNNGNVDQTANFLKAFEDAKIVFYDLSPLKNKFLNAEPFTEKEYTSLLKNASIIDWIPHNSQITVTKSYLERLHLTLKNTPPNKYIYLLKCIGLTIPANYFLPYDATIPVLIGLAIGFLQDAYRSTHLTNTVTIPFQEEDVAVCIEDMDSIIQRTAFT